MKARRRVKLQSVSILRETLRHDNYNILFIPAPDSLSLSLATTIIFAIRYASFSTRRWDPPRLFHRFVQCTANSVFLFSTSYRRGVCLISSIEPMWIAMRKRELLHPRTVAGNDAPLVVSYVELSWYFSILLRTREIYVQSVYTLFNT